MQKPFGPTQRLQKAYEQGIREITKRVLAPKSADQTFDQWLGAIVERSQRQDIQEASTELARRMVSWVSVRNAATWRQAASRSMQSRKLHSLLMREMQGATGARVSQLVHENARLISSLPIEAATMLTDEVRKAQQNGARPETVAKMMRQRFPKLVRSRVNLISRTETAKASSALTQARSEDVGAEFYIWLSSTDQRTRASHKNLHGVVIPWAQPPDPEALVGEASILGHYHSGACPNCRCTQIVVLEAEDIKFPARIYWNGAIKQMTKQQFKVIAA